MKSTHNQSKLPPLEAADNGKNVRTAKLVGKIAAFTSCVLAVYGVLSISNSSDFYEQYIAPYTERGPGIEPNISNINTNATPIPEQTIEHKQIPYLQKEDLKPGDTLGYIKIPSLGQDWETAIKQSYGNEKSDESNILKKYTVNGKMQLAHYENTETMGQNGNSVIAGHNGYTNQAFDHMNENFKKDDKVYVKTPQGYYTYTAVMKIAADKQTGQLVKMKSDGTIERNADGSPVMLDGLMFDNELSDGDKTVSGSFMTLQYCPNTGTADHKNVVYAWVVSLDDVTIDPSNGKFSGGFSDASPSNIGAWTLAS